PPGSLFLLQQGNPQNPVQAPKWMCRFFCRRPDCRRGSKDAPPLPETLAGRHAAHTRRTIPMRKQWLAAGLAVCLGGTATIRAQTLPADGAPTAQTSPLFPGVSSTPAGIILTTPLRGLPAEPR